MQRILLVLMCLASSVANADVFKCAGSDGRTSFSSTPCPVDKGVATWHGPSQATNLPDVQAESAEVVRRNLRATQIMRTGRSDLGQTRVTIVNESSRPVPKVKGPSKTIRSVCNNLGTATFCRDSEGGRSFTNNIGTRSFTTYKNEP